MNLMEDRRPIYRRLRDQIAAEIAQNIWKPGEAIATEAELAAKYHISVTTVRKAVDCLVSDGLIERVSGSGMFVRRPDFDYAFVRFTRVWGSAGDRRIPGSRIYKREALSGPPEVTSALNLEKGARVVRLLRLRLYEGAPIIREEIWLDGVRFAPVLTMEIEEDQPKLLYPVYENLCGAIVARAEETITIECADKADVELLGLRKGSSVVSVKRLSLGYDDNPIEWRYSRSSAKGFHYKIDIR